jgi:chaperonin GroEL
LNKPIFLLYDGIMNDISQILEGLTKLGNYFTSTRAQDRGVVLVAHGFSDMVLGDLHLNWNHLESTVKVVPLLTPVDVAIQNWRSQFLFDLQAYTGSPVFNPVDKPITELDPEQMSKNNRVKGIEIGRFRTSVISDEDDEALSIRVSELKERLKKPESDYEINDLNVRIGKLTSGIAKLSVSAPSAGESREKRDRAEDAWMAIRGAVKYGAVPGGGFILVRLSAQLMVEAEKLAKTPKKFAMNILARALLRPVEVLYENYGYKDESVAKQLTSMLGRTEQTFDISEQKWVDKYDILDSVPAVVEAIRNSISIASLLGTLGGIVAFRRDAQTDKEEERFVRKYEGGTGTRTSISTAKSSD